MILHIANDEKFIDFSITEFEKQYPKKNTFLIVVNDSKNYKLKHIKKIEYVKVISVNELRNNLDISAFKKYKLVILHLLDSNKAKFVFKLSKYKSIKFLWVAWGADFYQAHPALRRKLLLKKTKRIKKQIDFPLSLKGAFNFIKNTTKPILKFFGMYRDTLWYQKRAISKIQYLSTMIYDDYELIKKYYKAKHLQYIKFSYGSLEGRIAININNQIKLGNNILLGNSSSYTNNHVEIIDLLAKIKLASKIITPLNYGNMDYRKKVITYGKDKLRNKFHPLTNFMPLKDYNKLMQSCGYFIGNYKRQQAMGNIHAMLYIGAKVFLRKDNPAYQYLLKEGVSIFSIDEIKKKKEEAFKPLTEEQIYKNREYLIRTKGKEAVEKYHKDIVNLIK